MAKCDTALVVKSKVYADSRDNCFNEAGEVLQDEAVNERIAEAFENEGADAWFADGAKERFDVALAQNSTIADQYESLSKLLAKSLFACSCSKSMLCLRYLMSFSIWAS